MTGAELAAFVEPLLEADDDVGAIESVMYLGAIFSKMALVPDEVEANRLFEELVVRKSRLNKSGRRDLRVTARQMVKRHREMFPHLHQK